MVVGLPPIDNPFLHASQEFYNGTVLGTEGISNNNVTATGPDLKHAKFDGFDHTTKIFGITAGFGFSGDSRSIILGFGNSTYSLGNSTEGITYESSKIIDNKNFMGQKTTFSPTPLNAAVALVGAVAGTLVKALQYGVE